ncbi:hypothetical protein MMC28_002536 [Mycoblastus sanguinarius]|nr:hypothetical protein [Mycoblastus sanguinarius]
MDATKGKEELKGKEEPKEMEEQKAKEEPKENAKPKEKAEPWIAIMAAAKAAKEKALQENKRCGPDCPGIVECQNKDHATASGAYGPTQSTRDHDQTNGLYGWPIAAYGGHEWTGTSG